MARPQLPKSVKVGPYHYTVKPLPRKAFEDLGEERRDDLIIHLRKGMPLELERGTLMHEIDHAIDSLFGIADERDGERVVECRSNGWLMVLDDNPQLRTYLWPLLP